MHSTFQALVRFDVLGSDVTVSVGGQVDDDAVDELCEVVERSAAIAGRRAAVDLKDARIGAEACRAVRVRCRDFARIVGV
jgi:hypothetical protein